ncbi:monovalent cation:proton antiporter family protein [Methanoregula sp.]|uniref:monovalent cation:proton antiporter family protein n=1 Tax=Methanoregula sp. TaxID=2052170 RepID=UPI00260A4F2C|nr:monovalent cation:proton antiporter family protein [Methanoregula sp.]MDD5143016.1 cation:proton antiporter [Methanoregula sp.]
MELGLIANILIVFAVALFVGMVFNRIKVPPLVAFILTGAIVGPYGLSVIKGQDQVASLAELGIILLLFTIGLEFSFKDLWKIRAIAIVGGMLQVLLSFAFFFGLAFVLGLSVNQAILMGFLFSLSSTAIVLKILHERGEMDSPHGSIALGILIFQDLMAIPMIMAIPFLASIPLQDTTPLLSPEALVTLVIEDLAIVLVLIVLAKWIVPRVMHEIARTRNQELFLLVVILTCFGVAWMVSFTGMSLAIGALLAGLIISGSEYSHQATSIVLPFRDIFTSFFFISVGMLVDIRFLIANIWIVLFLIAIAILAKALLATAAPLALGYPLRTAVMTGLALAQVGEFSFIIAQSGFSAGIIPSGIYQTFLIVALMTMAATPFVLGIGQPLTGWLCSKPSLARIARGTCIVDENGKSPEKTDHLVIIGYGVTGRNLARTAARSGVVHTIVELNPDLVKAARNEGESVVFGDATAGGVLSHAGVPAARIAVVAINDPIATRKIVALCHSLNPALTIIVRTRYVSEAKDLHSLGADEVIAEEFETSVEIFTLVLHKYFVPRDQIETFIHDVRADGYQMLRTRNTVETTLPDLVRHIPHITIASLMVEPGSALDGMTLGGYNLRKRTNLLILAIRRGDQTITGLSGETELHAGDIAIIYASPVDIAKGTGLFLSGSPGSR